MKYLKKYEKVKTEKLLDEVFSDCKPFIEELRSCEKGSFLVRGVGKHGEEMYDIKKFTLNLDDRTPRDMPIETHVELNHLFDEYLGWDVRNGLFTFGRNVFDNDELTSSQQSKYGWLDTDYGQRTYLLFPCDDFEFAWSPQIMDLYSDLEGERIPLYLDEMYAEDEYNTQYGEGGKGEWHLNDISTYESDKDKAILYISYNFEDFDIKCDEEIYETEDDFVDNLELEIEDDLVWAPEMEWDDFLRDFEEDWRHELVKELENIIYNYEDDNLNDALLSYNEICVNCKNYYLIDQDHLEEIIERIWE